jgi:L-ribulokinase
MPTYTIGIDFGTNSVRALVVDCADGREAGTCVVNYPSGEDGILLDERDPNLARQNPGDWLWSLVQAVRGAVQDAKADDYAFVTESVVGIGVDTTGSTPLPVDENGTPLGMIDAFKDDLAAHAWLWKDHTGYAEAAEITQKAAAQGRPYLQKCGGTYSSEWFWSKILHCARTAPKVFEAAFSWVECQDYIPAWLTGTTDPLTMKRGVCAAGHKAMFHPSWGGLPTEDFLATLDPRLAALRGRLYRYAVPSDQPAGRLTPERANDLGLPAGLPVAVGAFDAHLGAVGSGVRPGVIVKIMGTSTCDIMVGGEDTPDIPGVCGVVPGSVIPGMVGIEAGQSAVGDLFNWAARLTGRSQVDLNEEALRLRPGESGLLALDWNNGNRTILVDPLLSGLLIGQSLHTDGAEVYRAMIEATAFGSRKIIEQIEKYGVKIEEVVTCGGIAEKSPLTMQVYADVIGRPMKTSRSSQTCALGSAIMASVVGSAHKDTLTAIAAMTGVKDEVYRPEPAAVKVYDRLYKLYTDLHDSFGTVKRQSGLHGAMKELIRIREEVRQA